MGQINWGESEGKGCMHIKDWLKPVFPLFLTRLLRKLKFLMSMVVFGPLPPALLTKLRLR